MKTAEKVLLAMIVLGIALKLAHVPGGASLTILSILVMGLFYFVGSYFLFDPKIQITINESVFYKARAPRVVLALLTGYCIMTCTIGILFRIMHWPGAVVMLLVGAVALSPIAITAIVRYRSNGADFYKQIAFRACAFLAISLTLFFFRLP